MLERKRLSILIAALTMTMASASCQTTGSTIVGKGPLALTPEVDNNFKSYLNLPDPLAFAVSPDGRYSGWYFCTEKNSCLGASANYEAVNYCNETTPRGSGSCKLYAMGKKVVWDGQVSVMSPQRQQQTAASLIGSGPPTLAPRVSENIMKYMKLQEPLAFAVSTDGKYNGLFYCKIKGTCSNIDAEKEALNFCRQDVGGGGADCKIYAVGKDVVWKAPVVRTAAVSQIGSGPLVIAPRVNENIVKYLKLEEPLAFAVSTDGKYNGLFYCKAKGTCSNIDAKIEALNFCRQDAGGSGADCRIYAVEKDVVWNGRVMVAGDQGLQLSEISPLMGNGPLTMSAETNRIFQQYQSRPEPMAFAVSNDGRHSGYFYCKEKGACLNADAKAAALNDCRQNSGESCKIYALGKDVVWNGRVRVAAAPPPQAAPAQAASFQAAPIESPQGTLMLSNAPAAPPPPAAAPQAAPTTPVAEETLTVNNVPTTKGRLRSSKAFRDLEEEIKRARQATVGAN